jgi:protein-disulfide isomerase
MSRTGCALAVVAISALAPIAQAATALPLDVVKFISFDCPVCRASEVMDAPIRELTQSRGGRFVVAPLPRGANEARERFYYVLRKWPEAETLVRLSLYRGAQDLNYPLNDVPQTLDWLESDLTVSGVDWTRVIAQVNDRESGAAVSRAVRLAIRAGLQVVPTYVLVQGDRVVATLDPKAVAGGELSALREAVLNALRKNQATH